MTTVKLANTLDNILKETGSKHLLDTLCKLEAEERMQRFQKGYQIALSHPTEHFLALEEKVQRHLQPNLAAARRLK